MIIETLSYGMFKITKNDIPYFTNDFKFVSVGDIITFNFNGVVLQEDVSNITIDNVIQPSIDHFMTYLLSYDNNVGYKQVRIFIPEE